MTINLKRIGKIVRDSRIDRGIESLDQLADRIAVFGVEKPSLAKLSRIETGIQPVPIDILPALAAIIGVPASRLRPDLAAMFLENVA